MAGPKPPPEKDRLLKQVPIRFHTNDYAILRQLLSQDGMSFQTLVTALVDGYMRADKDIMRVIKDWQEMNEIPKDVKDRYSLSQRDRRAILDEIEAAKDPIDR